MDVLYSPERVTLHREVCERRAARQQRRMARIARRERQERVLGAVKTVLGYLFGAALFMAYLFAGALWASM